jgi:hypothetical protein
VPDIPDDCHDDLDARFALDPGYGAVNAPVVVRRRRRAAAR